MDKNHNGEIAPAEPVGPGGFPSLEGGGKTPGAGLVLPGIGFRAGAGTVEDDGLTVGGGLTEGDGLTVGGGLTGEPPAGEIFDIAKEGEEDPAARFWVLLDDDNN